MKHKIKIILFEVILMVVLQLLYFVTKMGFAAIIPGGPFGKKMTAMCAMIILTLLFVIYTKIRGVTIKVFPKPFSKGYIIITIITALLMIFTPENFIKGYISILLILYGSIVTPVFEELIFREYIWKQLQSAFKSDWCVFITDALLFMVWHLGYMMPQLLDGNWFAVVTKLGAGLCYGVVLSFIRMKTRNCYSTMLVHGILNLLMV